MGASVVNWSCPACGEEGMGDMPEVHAEHAAPKARELIAIVHPSFGWCLTMSPIELLSPMQREGLYFDRGSGWWCAPLP